MGDLMKKVGSFLLLILFISMLIQGEGTYDAAHDALFLWFEKLIPSMFVSMVCVRILYDTKILPLLVKPFRFLIHPLFGLDEHSFALVLSSIALGFPTGAMLIDEEAAAGNLTPREARRLIYTCSFATPGFIIMSCGVALYHDVHIGFQLFIISLFSGLVLLMVTRGTNIEIRSIHHPDIPIFTSLTSAISSSVKALYMIGGYLMLTMCVLAIIQPFLPEVLSCILNIISEFSSGSLNCFQLPLPLVSRLIINSSLLAFGGLCVHLQVMSMCQHTSLSYIKYVSYRILQALISAILAMLIF